MPYRLEVDGESGRLLAWTSGTVSEEESDRLVEDAKRLCRKHSLRSVLIELDHTSTGTDDLAVYRLARSWAEFARGRVRTAMVLGHLPEVDRYFGDILREHGVKLGLFDSRVEAEVWLGRKMTPIGPLGHA
ncbi:MAG: hypothetical protein ACYTKD_04800 [Planctomycetota bacterium]|jgi:hypothetical protein